jgi:signal transduction histidine kinase
MSRAVTHPTSDIRHPKSPLDRAAFAYEWELVTSLVGEALEPAELAPAEEYELRLARVEANDYLGQHQAKKDDLTIMLELAQGMGDTKRRIMALSKLSFTLADMGEVDEAKEAGEAGLRLARQIGDQGLEADCLCMLGWGVVLHGYHQQTIDYFEAAIDAARAAENLAAKAFATTFLSFPYVSIGQDEKANALGRQGLRLAKKLADRRQEVWSYVNLGVVSRDLASSRAYFQQAEDLARAIDFRAAIVGLENNIAMLYWRFGLYGRALAYAQSAIAAARKYGTESLVYTSVDTLARIAYSSGDLPLAQDAYAELIEIGRATDNVSALSFGTLGLGLVAMEENRLDDALEDLQQAVALFDDTDQLIEHAISLSALSAAHMKMGAYARALEASSAATALVDGKQLAATGYPTQDIWWQHYVVLSQGDGDETGATWELLEKARELMFSAIETTGDEGLRRNYLNKVPVNRRLSEAWVREAAHRGRYLNPYTERKTTPAALAAQLQRIVDSGARLAVERDTERLAEFVLQEFVELSGVERAVVALESDAATVGAVREPPHQWVATAGQDGGLDAFAQPFIEQAAAARIPQLVDSAGDVPAGENPLLHQRSIIALPLVSQGKVWGVLYGDMRHLFGRLNYNDRDILSLLANQAGAALENANWVETLEQQVAERTAEAERANEAKSTFISNMSHELRTPLNAIIGFTRIVQRKTKDQIPQKQVDNLGKVLESGEHLLGLINTILDIAKIEAGRMDVVNNRFHIGPLIESTITISQPLLKPGVVLKHEITDDLPEMNSDQDKIKQILLNLLSNAAKFTHDGTISVSVKSKLLSVNSDQSTVLPMLVIEVADTGIGMNEEALGRVFEEFQQADTTTTRKYGGTGLGMPISRHLAQLLGGDLTVESEEGVGSMFRLIMPVEQQKR